LTTAADPFSREDDISVVRRIEDMTFGERV
jgi:hypothetical protein